MSDPPRLKLLVITMMYEPDCVGIAAVASDMCAALAERGHDVTVYTTYPYYPEWKLKSEASWRVREEFIRGVRVRRHRIFVPSRPSRLLPRLIHELSFPISLMRSFFYGKKYDAVMVYCPLIGGVAFAALRKLWFRDPLWVSIQDIPVEAASASGIIKSGWLARFATFSQSWILNRADVWSTISPEMVEQVQGVKRDGIPLHLFPNWLTGSLGQQIKQTPPRIGRNPTEPRNLLYCGTVGKKQGLLEFCQMLARSDAGFRFEIRGEGSEAGAVREWVENSGDRRFHFGGLLPQDEFIQAIHDADWFVIPQKSSVGSAFFPSKLIPAISLGTPILAITETSGPLGKEMQDNGLGLLVPWAEVEQVPRLLDAVEQDEAQYEEFEANCLRRALSYDRQYAINRLETLLWEEGAYHEGQPTQG